jgi:hypothetical protein
MPHIDDHGHAGEDAGAGCSGPSCICEAAVKRAYAALQQAGRPEHVCYQAALIIFRWHHPELSLIAAESSVSAWTRTATLH